MIKFSAPFLLSSTGSTRASAYGFSNKSITLNGKTHVVWLDAIARVCGRTYDRETQQWSEAYSCFDGCDNHTSPALTVDKDGHLHLVYGPHGWWGGWNMGCFKWVKSEQPNNIAVWTDEQQFGYNATYASMIHLPRGHDAIVYRGGESPSSLMFQRQREKGGWSSARELVRQEIEPQYTHVGGITTCDRDGAIYVAGHLYNVCGDFGKPPESRETYGLVILRSADMGATWSDLRGQPVTVPTLYQERIALPPMLPYRGDRRLAGLSLESTGAVWVLVSSPQLATRELLLSRWDGVNWVTIDVAEFIPQDWNAVDAVLTIDTRDRIHIAVTAVQPTRVATTRVWGNPACEVFHLCSVDAGRTFASHQVSTGDDEQANWLPNISLGGIYNPVENPVILYTHGVAGEGCSPPTTTEVYCVLTHDA